MKQLKSIWWEMVADKPGVAWRIGEIAPEHAIEILQWRKTELWDEIRQIRRWLIEKPEFERELGKTAVRQMLSGKITEQAAISWALEQADIRAEV